MLTTVPRPFPLRAAVLSAVLAGPLMDAGFPDMNVWPLTLVGVGLLLAALQGQSVRGGALIGFTAGISFYLTHIAWVGQYLGPVPWLALTVTESLFWALFGGLAAATYRHVPRAWPGRWARLVLVPTVISGLWVGREEVAGSWPYGGFSWGRVAMSQSEGPFADVVSWTGMAGLSFLLVLLVAGAVSGICERERVAPVATVLLAAATVLLLVPVFPVQVTGSFRIAAVQGNGPAGYFSERSPGDLLKAQLDASSGLEAEDLDAIVWPENASEFDPFSTAAEKNRVAMIAKRLGAPLTLGTITQRNGRYFNSTVAVDPDRGIVDVYDKKHPVPFGEYVPDREFWEKLAPDLIGMIQREYVPGQRDGILDLGPIAAGSAICFDITDDRVMRELIDDGAELILAQSNNADFGRTDESVQQLAIARLRAIEYGRTVVNISTVGTSAIISPTGATIAELKPFTAGTMIETVQTANGITPAAQIGRGLAVVLTIAPLLILVTARATTVRRFSRS
jgi:apolipoprotein N-acyltransferase